MSTKRVAGVGLVLMAFTLSASFLLAGPEKTSPSGQTEEVSSPAVAPDPAFDRYVDLTLMHRAWEGRDADLLTDVGLQVAEGEHVLQRTHSSGITADQLLGLAAKLAADTKNKGCLHRLGKAAESRGNQALANRVASAVKLAGENRAPDPALNVSVANISAEAVARFQGMNKAVQSARLLEDREALDSLEKEMPKEGELPEAQRSYLTKSLKEAGDRQKDVG